MYRIGVTFQLHGATSSHLILSLKSGETCSTYLFLISTFLPSSHDPFNSPSINLLLISYIVITKITLPAPPSPLGMAWHWITMTWPLSFSNSLFSPFSTTSQNHTLALILTLTPPPSLPPCFPPLDADVDLAAIGKEESKSLRNRVLGLMFQHLPWLLCGLIGAAMVISCVHARSHYMSCAILIFSLEMLHLIYPSFRPYI